MPVAGSFVNLMNRDVHACIQKPSASVQNRPDTKKLHQNSHSANETSRKRERKKDYYVYTMK